MLALTHIFKILFLMSTSFSTIRSSNCWGLKSFRLKAVLHSGHAADGRVKSVSTQFSHLTFHLISLGQCVVPQNIHLPPPHGKVIENSKGEIEGWQKKKGFEEKLWC